MAASDAMPVPKRNVAYRLTFEARLNTGALNTTGTGMDSELSGDAGTFADATNEATEIATNSGVYYIDLTAGEMNFDTVVVKTTFTNSNSIPSVIVLNPQETDDIRVNATYLGGTAQTGRDIGASVLLSPGTGTGQLDITSGVVKANLVQILATALTETAGQIAAAFKQFFDVATPTGTMKAITNVVTTTTATNLTNAPTAGDFTAVMKTSLNAATPAVTVSDKTGFSLSTAGILAIWHQLTSAIVTASTIGKLLVDNINATIASRSTYAGTDTPGTTTLLGRIPGTVQPQTGDAFARLGAPAGASISADIAAVPDVTEIGDAVWDEVLAGHVGVGSTGEALSAAGSAGDPWIAPLPGAYAAGQAGFILGTNLDAQVSSRAPSATAVSNVDLTPTRAAKLDNLDAAITTRSTLTAIQVWQYVIEGALTAERVVRIMLSALAGKLSGVSTNAPKFRDLADTKDRISATTTADGRTSVTLDGS